MPIQNELPKMSFELAALSDIAALEYGKEKGLDVEGDYYSSNTAVNLTEAHEAGQSWMYRKLQAELESLRKERDDYRLALAIFSTSLEKDYPNSFSEIQNLLAKYPTEQTESHE